MFVPGVSSDPISLFRFQLEFDYTEISCQLFAFRTLMLISEFWHRIIALLDTEI